jgi:hypothetical protein
VFGGKTRPHLIDSNGTRRIGFQSVISGGYLLSYTIIVRNPSRITSLSLAYSPVCTLDFTISISLYKTTARMDEDAQVSLPIP